MSESIESGLRFYREFSIFDKCMATDGGSLRIKHELAELGSQFVREIPFDTAVMVRIGQRKHRDERNLRDVYRFIVELIKCQTMNTHVYGNSEILCPRCQEWFVEMSKVAKEIQF